MGVSFGGRCSHAPHHRPGPGGGHGAADRHRDGHSNDLMRIALIGGSAFYHAQAFSQLLNIDWQDDATREKDVANGFPKPPVPVRITAVWDEDRSAAEKLAEAYHIDAVYSSIDDALDNVDAAIIIDNVVMTHHRWAPKVIEKGVPVLIDKPLAPTYDEAKAIVQLAREHNALMFSSSALAFTRELAEIQPALDEEGGVQLAIATAPNGQFLFYGIHAVTAVYSLLGPGIASVQHMGEANRHSARFQWHGGQTGVFVVDERVRDFTLVLYTAKSARTVIVRDARYFYFNMLMQLVNMVLTKHIPVPWEHTLEIIKALDTVARAAAAGDQSVVEV